MTDEGMGMPAGKRRGPKPVPPVTIGNVRFEVLHWGKSRDLGQNGGYIAAFDPKSNQELWILKVYDVNYDPGMEGDVQDIFIKTMTKGSSGNELEIVDEEGRKYLVDPGTRSVKSV